MLSPLDAEFLDGMIQVNDMVRQAANNYLQQSDGTSDVGVIDIARQTIEMADASDAAYKEKRGHADGDTLRTQANEDAVEVTAAY